MTLEWSVAYALSFYPTQMLMTMLPHRRLHDNKASSNDSMLFETMQLLKSTGDRWVEVFQKQYFPTIAVDNLTAPFGVLTWYGQLHCSEVLIVSGIGMGSTWQRDSKHLRQLGGLLTTRQVS